MNEIIAICMIPVMIKLVQFYIGVGVRHKEKMKRPKPTGRVSSLFVKTAGWLFSCKQSVLKCLDRSQRKN